MTSGGWVDTSEAGGGFHRGLDRQYEPRSSMDRRWVTSGGWVDASEAGGRFRRGLDRLQLCPFFGGSVLIGANRWFRCSGRGWIDVVCVVVERH
jgi:hypothetical protein